MARRTGLVAVAMVMAALVAGCQDTGRAPDPSPTKAPGKPVALKFLAYGPEEELAAYATMVKAFNDGQDGVNVSLVTAKNRNQAMKQLRTGDVPDVFLLSHADLAEVVDAGINQPIEDPLDQRGVDFSDGFKRTGNIAFAHSAHLQCMPYGISPMVIYYNKSLIDFETMGEQGLPRPASHNGWTLEQFAAAAEYAAGPGTKGVYIEPSLLGLSPFVYSGGGDLYDDEDEPTSLALSSGDSRSALDRTLSVLRKDQISPTPKQLRKQSALDRFKTGKLGMIAGFRDLVPELRKTPSLDFDVMPMPALDDERTVGDITGLCISAKVSRLGAAADFIVHAISEESVATVAEVGYLVPTNNAAAESEAFLQPDQLPMNPEVFNRSVRDIVIPPLLQNSAELERAVHAEVYRLLYAPVLDLEAVTQAIDEASRPVIDPESVEEDPSAPPSP